MVELAQVTPPPSEAPADVRPVVLHVFRRMDRGGAELRTVSLMETTLGTSFDFHFCTLGTSAGSLDGWIHEHGGEVHPLPYDLLLPLRFLRLLRSLRPAVVHSHVWLLSGLFLSLARVARVKRRIAHFRTVMSIEMSASPARRLVRRLLRLATAWSATAIVGVTEAALTSIWSSPQRRTRRKFRVIANGFAIESLSREQRAALRSRFGVGGQPSCVFLGRNHSSKRPEIALRAFLQAAAHDPALHLVMIGGGIPKLANHPVLEQSPARARVQLLEATPNRLEIVGACDILLLTSSREGSPGALVEALLLGLRAVASDLPGCREIAARSPRVRLVDVDAPIEQWAAAIVATRAEEESSELDTSELAEYFAIGRHVAAIEALWTA